ncbi:MAG: heme-binding protein [Proteobacteria bacterium]|nr:heme-binding protein [Pseudomonadota bacterium]
MTMRTYGALMVASAFTLGFSAKGFGAKVCSDLPSFKLLSSALTKVVAMDNGGIFSPNMMWATIVHRDGTVCAVAKVGDAWPGSRVISAQKASTANAFSNNKLALSTANLFSAVQPGASLFGLQESNPVNGQVAYVGNSSNWGTSSDALMGNRIGGVNVFGGGLGLYKSGSTNVVGGLGVSGDSSCADHIIAWRIRAELGLDKIPGGISSAGDDNMIHDISESGKSAGGFGHPTCSAKATEIAKGLTVSNKK